MATSEQVRGTLTRVLAAWSVGSIAVGTLVLARRPGERATGFARQTLAWGAVDLAIAGLSLRRPHPVPHSAPDSVLDPVGNLVPEAAAVTSLRRLLLLNSVLDVGYVTAGAVLWRAGRVRGRDSTGDGAGVVVQGAFLLVLDTVCALRLRTTPL